MTEEQIAQAAATLVQAGQPVTVVAVRDALGGAGDYTAINKYLSAWRAQQAATEIEIPDIPPTVEQEILTAMQLIWRAAAVHTQEAIAELKKSTTKQLAHYEAELKEARQEIGRLEQETVDLAEALTQAQAVHGNLTGQLTQTQMELTVLQERARQQDERIHEHRAQLARSQSELDRERTATAKAQEETQKVRMALETMRENTQEARRENARLEEEIIDQAEALAHAQQMAERTEELAQTLEAEKTTRQTAEQQVEQLRERQTAIEAEKENLGQSWETERQHRQQAEKTAIELRESVAALKAERAAEERRAAELANQVAQLQDQLVKLVGQEHRHAAPPDYQRKPDTSTTAE